MRFSARNLLIVLVLFILFLTFTGAFFIVNETKQALVLQFGDPRKVVTKPGLQFKIPFTGFFGSGKGTGTPWKPSESAFSFWSDL